MTTAIRLATARVGDLAAHLSGRGIHQPQRRGGLLESLPHPLRF